MKTSFFFSYFPLFLKYQLVLLTVSYNITKMSPYMPVQIHTYKKGLNDAVILVCTFTDWANFLLFLAVGEEVYLTYLYCA